MRPYRVALVPGHGGFDPGAVNSTRQVRECDGNLAVALKLAVLLNSNGLDSVLSRTSDRACGDAQTPAQDVANQIDFVNRCGADIAVAIHFNGSVNINATGTEVLYSDARYPHPRKAELAGLLLAELAAATGLRNRGLKTPDQVSLLTKTKIPCVLSECAFVSNDRESVWCSDPDHQQQLAAAHARAICRYFGLTCRGEKGEGRLAPVRLVVNGKPLPHAYISPVDGRDTSFAPVRALAEALGARVAWDAACSTVRVEKED